MRGVELKGAILEGCVFRGCSFRGCRSRGCANKAEPFTVKIPSEIKPSSGQSTTCISGKKQSCIFKKSKDYEPKLYFNTKCIIYSSKLNATQTFYEKYIKRMHVL